MQRSYFEIHRRTTSPESPLRPYGLGRPATFSVGRSPVGVEMLDIWKWWNPRFPRGRWKSFPTDLLEMEEVQDRRHFQISKVISMDMKAGPGKWTSGSD